ncbi:MAG TPA: lactonase family protein [Planctomycetaceae bacterium]|jgi:6-phosphogluconolactonase|nr:lactonase family protein [Planctomycetaceae bacterium]
MKTVLLHTAFCLLIIGGASTAPAAEGRERIYLGTYGQGPKDGVFVAELDLASGQVSEPRFAGRAANASFVALHPDHRHLYTVAEVSSLGGRRTGGVIAFSIAPETGALRQINEQESGGAGPCHLVVDKTGKHVLVANYEGGSVAVLPIDERGGLKRASSIQLHHGKGPNPARQEAAHAHSVNLDAANRFAFVADLGLDKVFVYRFDAAGGKLSANQPPTVKTTAGAGPRHLAFDRTGRFVYVIDELDSTITTFWYDAENGTLSKIQVVSTLPKDFHGENTASEVAVHPSGNFVYGANRGHDSLAIFSVDPVSGKLTPEGHESTQGKTPRNFAIDPTGAFLLAANQDSDSVVVFRIDPTTGRLRPTGQRLQVHQPVCIRYLAL